jgi:hypothetical protein
MRRTCTVHVNDACEYPCCPLPRLYGNRHDKVRRRCGTHKTGNDALISNVCVVDGCTAWARYGELTSTATHCSAHRSVEHVDKISRKCIHEGCMTQPVFGESRNERPIYCKRHKTPTSFNVVQPLCAQESCQKRGIYADVDEGGPVYCSDHAPEMNVPVGYKRCLHRGCRTVPSYGHPLIGIREYCTAHKTDDDVVIRHARCPVEDCENTVVTRKPYCFEHRTVVDRNSRDSSSKKRQRVDVCGECTTE